MKFLIIENFIFQYRINLTTQTTSPYYMSITEPSRMCIKLSRETMELSRNSGSLCSEIGFLVSQHFMLFHIISAAMKKSDTG